MLVIADLPTVALYWLLQHLGFDSTITHASDLKFLLIGVAWWATIGALAGAWWERRSQSDPGAG